MTTSQRVSPLSSSTETRRRSKSNGTSSIFFQAPTSMCVVVEDGFVERALQAGLEEAVEIGEFQHPLAGLALRIDVLLQPDLRLGQRAGLVGAQHVHRAEVLDGGQPFDDHVLLRHAQRAARQRDRHHHRQQFRRQADGERDGEQEGLQPGLVEEGIHQQHEQHHQDRQPHDQHAEAARADLERGRRRRPGNAVGDRADRGAGARS